MTTEKTAAAAATAKPCRFVALPESFVDDSINSLRGILKFVDYVEAEYIDSYTVFAEPLDMGDPRDAADWHAVASAAASRRNLMNMIADLELERGVSQLEGVSFIERVAIGDDTSVSITGGSKAALGRAVALLKIGRKQADEQYEALNRQVSVAECNIQIELWKQKKEALLDNAPIEDTSPEGLAIAKLAQRHAAKVQS